MKFHCFLPAPPPPPPPHFCCFPYTTTTTANTFLLFSFHHHHHYRHHHISIVFLHQRQISIFLTTITTATAFLLFSLHHHHHHHISIVFFHNHHRHHISIVFPPPPQSPRFHFFPPRDSMKDYQLPFLVHFVAMSRVVNNNHGFLHFLDRSVTWSAVPRATTSRARAESIAKTLKASLLYSS